MVLQVVHQVSTLTYFWFTSNLGMMVAVQVVYTAAAPRTSARPLFFASLLAYEFRSSRTSAICRIIGHGDLFNEQWAREQGPGRPLMVYRW